MKTLTVKVPEKLDLKLAAVAAKRGESKSNLIRTAIESILNANEAFAPKIAGPPRLAHGDGWYSNSEFVIFNASLKARIFLSYPEGKIKES